MDNSAQRQQLSNAYNTAKKSFGFRASLVPAKFATDYAKGQLISMGEGTMAKQLRNKDMKKIKKAVLDKKNKDKLIDATIALQQQDKSKAENFLNELGLSHLAPAADVLLKTANPHYQGQMMQQAPPNPETTAQMLQAASNPETAAKMGIDPQVSAKIASDPKFAEKIAANPDMLTKLMNDDIKTVENIGDDSFNVSDNIMY